METEHVREHGLTPGCRGCLNADSGNPIAKNHTQACRERFLKIYEEKHPEKFFKITEKFLRAREGEEERVRAAPEVEERDLPRDTDMEEGLGADHYEAQSSYEVAVSNDVEMGNVTYSISADRDLQRKVQEWDSKSEKTQVKHRMTM